MNKAKRAQAARRRARRQREEQRTIAILRRMLLDAQASAHWWRMEAVRCGVDRALPGAPEVASGRALTPGSPLPPADETPHG